MHRNEFGPSEISASVSARPSQVTDRRKSLAFSQTFLRSFCPVKANISIVTRRGVEPKGFWLAWCFFARKRKKKPKRSAWLDAADYADRRSCPAEASRKGNPQGCGHFVNSPLYTIRNRKGDCAWRCSTWQTQPEKIWKSQRTNQCHSLRTLYWFVLCNLQIFSGCVCHLEQRHAQSPFLFPVVFSTKAMCFFFYVSRHFFSPNPRGRAEKTKGPKRTHWLSVPDHLTDKY